MSMEELSRGSKTLVTLGLRTRGEREKDGGLKAAATARDAGRKE